MSIRAQTRFAALAILFASIFLTACASGEKIQSNALSRIAFGSCAGDWVDQPIWDAIADQNPDLYISMGDAIYADWDGEKLVEVTPVSLREKWDELAQLPGFAKLRKNVPMIATWDNHDYGSHDRGADFALKEDSKAIFLDFWDEPDNSVRRRSSGIFADYFYGWIRRVLELMPNFLVINNGAG
jgi:alkaline phosphatase D